MNGWLRFKGDVTVTGEYLDSGKVTLRDDSGAYVAIAPEIRATCNIYGG